MYTGATHRGNAWFMNSLNTNCSDLMNENQISFLRATKFGRAAQNSFQDPSEGFGSILLGRERGNWTDLKEIPSLPVACPLCSSSSPSSLHLNPSLVFVTMLMAEEPRRLKPISELLFSRFWNMKSGRAAREELPSFDLLLFYYYCQAPRAHIEWKITISTISFLHF